MDYILGTAGHVDHGKTSLVARLTGIDCDRLEEEKRRGITIDLGFAWMDLPEKRRIGIVDVPGHERFVKNMVAGATGMDCVMLVIAADEGVMPQTREHLEICSLLGIRTGFVALTKIDLADAEWLEIVQEDIKNALAGTFLQDTHIIPVSSVTGEGINKIREEIAKSILEFVLYPKSDIFRLPVDRIFSMKGFGTIVTGTIVSGDCSAGEKLCVMPEEKPTRARSLEVHNSSVVHASNGQRCAINLLGLEVSDIERGNVLARPGTLFPSDRWFVRLNYLKSARLPLKQRTEVHFHHGSGETLAKIVFPDREQLEPGESSIAEVKFKKPLTAIYGDRYVLRSQSPLRTIGGGVVINPLPPLIRRRDPDYAEKLYIMNELGAEDKIDPFHIAHMEPVTFVNLVLALYPAPGLPESRLLVLTGLPKNILNEALGVLSAKNLAYSWDGTSPYWIGENALKTCLEKCKQRIQELHEREPFRSSFAATALINGWGEEFPEKAIQKILDLAIERKLLEYSVAGYKLAGHKFSPDSDSIRIMNLIVAKIKAGRRTPPFIKEILEEEKLDPKKVQSILNYLCECGKLLKIQEGIYYDSGTFSELIEQIRSWFTKKQELEIGDLKNILGLSRKYAIPLLEYLDSIRFTNRIGNKRRLNQP